MISLNALISEFEAAKAKRGNWDSVWQEIADYMAPSRASFTQTHTPGANRRSKIFDSTPEEANEALAAGLHGMMTSRSQRWFYLRPQRYDLRGKSRVSRYVDDVLTAMYAVINDPEVGFHTQIDQTYQDLGAFGNGILYTETNGPKPIIFQSKHLSNCYVVYDTYGILSAVHYMYSWTTEQIVHRFGIDSLPDALRQAYELGNRHGDVHDVLHSVKRREPKDVGRVFGSKGFPYGSYWTLMKEKHPLSESGYKDMPYLVARWRVRTGEDYGIGPGERMLPEARMLNEMYKSVMMAAQKALQPPLQLPDDSFINPISTRPSGLNYYRMGTGGKIEPIESRHRVDIGAELLEQQRQRIRVGFFQDAFDITSDSDGVNVKATFTMQRRDDKFRRLSPVFSRLDSELFEPAIQRLFAVMESKGMLPDAPPELDNEPLEIDYVSPVARAMRTSEADDILRLMELAAPLAEVDPDALLNIDASAAVRLAGSELFNVPARIMRSEAEVKELKEQRNQDREQEQQLASGQAAASALKDASSAQQNFNAS